MKWLVEFEEKPIEELGDVDVIDSPEELLCFLNAWIADDPQRAKWLKATSAVKLD